MIDFENLTPKTTTIHFEETISYSLQHSQKVSREISQSTKLLKRDELIDIPPGIGEQSSTSSSSALSSPYAQVSVSLSISSTS
tara:strand:+ start:603 stop:851 length:249 start_codon:yes stop_codon:yes gene_type:complete